MISINNRLNIATDTINTVRTYCREDTNSITKLKETINQHLTYKHRITNTIIPIVTQSLSTSKTTIAIKVIKSQIEETLEYHEAIVPSHVEANDDDNSKHDINTEQ